MSTGRKLHFAWQIASHHRRDRQQPRPHAL
jgi:hypothetical protein